MQHQWSFLKTLDNEITIIRNHQSQEMMTKNDFINLNWKNLVTLNFHRVRTINFSVWSLPSSSSLQNISIWTAKKTCFQITRCRRQKHTWEWTSEIKKDQRSDFSSHSHLYDFLVLISSQHIFVEFVRLLEKTVSGIFVSMAKTKAAKFVSEWIKMSEIK